MRAMALKSEFTDDSSLEAIALLERAIEIDEGYGRAYAQMAWTIAWRIHQGWEDTSVGLKASIEAAEKAVRRDPNEPWAYIAWLFIATILRDAELLLASPRRALEINPNFAMANSWMGAALALTGRGAEAFEWIERARKLSPRDVLRDEFDVHMSYAHFQVSDYENAYSAALRASLPHPKHVYPRLVMASSLGHSGSQSLGEAQVARILELAPNMSLESARASCVFVRTDDIDRFIEGLALSGMA